MSNAPPSPTWQPITQLPMIAWAIDGMAESADEQFANLQQAEPRPYVLDRPTIDRLTTVYTEQQGDLWLYREQLARWGKLALTTTHRAEVLRLEQRLTALDAQITAILALAKRLRAHTIESVLAKSDVELGLEVLLGTPLPPTPTKRPAPGADDHDVGGSA